MNWTIATTTFFIGFILGRSIRFLKLISVSMKTILIAQFQSLLMMLKSTEHVAMLRMWEEKTAEGIDEVRQAFKASIDESKELTPVRKKNCYSSLIRNTLKNLNEFGTLRKSGKKIGKIRQLTLSKERCILMRV